MKIAITTKDDLGLDAKIDSRFGRAKFFAFVELETLETEFKENPAIKAASGAGVLAAQTIADQKVSALISGNIGPKAFQGLKVAGLELFSCTGATLREAVTAYQNGKLKKLSGPTNGAHASLR